jgi:hypothetical protein
MRCGELGARTIAFTILIASLGTAANKVHAQGNACDQLWWERNSIYHSAGFCFKTERGINAFGNAGCRYYSEFQLPLSFSDRARINEIVARERQLGCR